jgi:hypothetical protein
MNQDQRSVRAVFSEMVVGIRQIVRAHNFKDEVAGYMAELLKHLCETFVERRCENHQRAILAMFRDLVEGMQQIIAANSLKDEVVWHIGDVLANLFTTYVECRCEEQTPQRRGAPPTMVELLARLERYASDHEESLINAAPAVN